MEIIKLFESEEIVSQSADKMVTLTNFRLTYYTHGLGKSHFVSIHHQDIASVEVHYRSIILFLIVGILGVIACLYFGTMGIGELFMLSGALAFIFLLIFFLTRKHVVTVSSNGGAKIQFFTKGMKKETLFDFINKIEKAKNYRLKFSQP